MKKEISQAFTSEGIPGVEKLIKDTIKQNDRKWFLLFCLMAVIFGGWISLHECKNVPDNAQVQAHENKVCGLRLHVVMA